MTRISLICPACHALLQLETDGHVCPTCRQIYPHTLGIPDLCWPEAKPSRVETALIEQLCELYPTATFEELVLTRLSALFTSAHLTVKKRRQCFTQYSLTMQTRGQRFYRMFRNKLAQHLSIPRPGLALDIGCGIGAGIAALAADFEHVIGLDISMSALITAKKLVESEGLTNVTLIRGTALNMPFINGTFDYCMAINVPEHIFEPATMLNNVYRVLAVGGVFSGDSRNRFDLLFPEPHVELRWVGFLPRKWMASYVHWRTGTNYDYTYLLSYNDLECALTTSFGDEWRIVIPDVSAYGVPTAVKRLVEWMNNITPLRFILVRLSPSHWALARRVAGSAVPAFGH